MVSRPTYIPARWLCFLRLTFDDMLPPAENLHGQNEHGNGKGQPFSSSSLADLEALSEGAKNRHLHNRPHWTLALIGRDPAYRGPSVTGQLVGPFIQRALNDGHAVFLVASNPHARDVYLKLGFWIAEELKVGEGRCDELGNFNPGGGGVSVWAMVIDRVQEMKQGAGLGIVDPGGAVCSYRELI